MARDSRTYGSETHSSPRRIEQLQVIYISEAGLAEQVPKAVAFH